MVFCSKPFTTTMFMFFFLFILQTKTLTAKTATVNSPTTFSFMSFSTESCTNGELLCMGSATSNNGYISLTPEPEQSNSSGSMIGTVNTENKVGRVLYPHPIHVWPAIITTTFTFRMTPFSVNSTGSGDGIALVFAQDNRPSPNDSFGSYLGMFDRSTQGGKFQQIGVELDTFMNEFDPDGNHIGIVTTSITNPIAFQSLNSTNVDLKSGRDIEVKVDYNGWTKIISISLGYTKSQMKNVLNHSINLPDIIPSSVYVGFTASTGLTLPQTHQILNWVFTSVPLPALSVKHSEISKIKIVLISVLPVLVLVSIVSLLWEIWKKIYEKGIRKEDIEKLSWTAADAPKMFGYKELSKATCKFSKENLVGRGGFGSVYKGFMLENGKTIAVKKISATSKQGEREFLSEICTIGRLRHKNLVQLQGWCNEGKNLLLVYDYMQNGSLDQFIGKDILDWQTRYKILTGLASALLYLHEECGNPVVHRDVKPNNIMLDSSYNAHLGDFGLARLLKNEDSVTTNLAGTPGYLAPEIGFTGKATPESDVYSFGMVILEVICGKRSKRVMEDNSLVDYVWNLHGQNQIVDCVDQHLKNQFDVEQAKRGLMVGLACLHPDSLFRPKMRKIMNIFLNANEPLMELPETRPTGVYVSVSCTSFTDFVSRTDLQLQSSRTTSMDKTSPSGSLHLT